MKKRLICAAASAVIAAVSVPYVNAEAENINSLSEITLNYQNNYEQTNSNMLGGKIKLKNTTGKDLDLKYIKIKYYFNADNSEKQNFWCDYSGITFGNYRNFTQYVRGDFSKGDDLEESKKNLLTLTFTDGILKPDEEFEIQFRIADENWQYFDQSNDFVYNKGLLLESADENADNAEKSFDIKTSDNKNDSAVNEGQAENENYKKTEVKTDNKNNDSVLKTDDKNAEYFNISQYSQTNKLQFNFNSYTKFDEGISFELDSNKINIQFNNLPNKKTAVTENDTASKADVQKPEEQVSDNNASNSAEAKKGTSLTIDGTKLLDVAGNEIVMKGINIAAGGYTDEIETSVNEVADIGVNTVRAWISDGSKWTKTSREDVQKLVDVCRKRNLVCVIDVHDYLGKNDPADIEKAVEYWKTLKDILNENEDNVILNIANEWLGDETKFDLWSPTYQKAIKELRSAGINNIIMIDAPGWGQQVEPMAEACNEVFESDPLKKTMFSIHMYERAGKDAEVIKNNIDSMLNQGVCTVIGEYGAGKEYGSNAQIDSKTILDYSQQKGMGSIAWSWKGNTYEGTEHLDMAKDWEGKELTTWGEFVINSQNGIKNTSKPVTLADKK